jgi:hypothetical protein
LGVVKGVDGHLSGDEDVGGVGAGAEELAEGRLVVAGGWASAALARFEELGGIEWW